MKSELPEGFVRVIERFTGSAKIDKAQKFLPPFDERSQRKTTAA